LAVKTGITSLTWLTVQHANLCARLWQLCLIRESYACILGCILLVEMSLNEVSIRARTIELTKVVKRIHYFLNQEIDSNNGYLSDTLVPGTQLA
jgi:hypothetical protein